MGQLTDFYITFGYGHPGHPGYVRISAPDHHTARQMMFDKYGDKWMTSYRQLSDVHPFDRIERDHLTFEDNHL